jgi:gas vesicle protein
MSTQNNEFTKGMVIGALLGGAIGAVTALLFAPKPGNELRRDIADKSADLYNDVYSKASDFVRERSTDVSTFVNEGKVRAEELVNSTKKQAGHLLYEAESLIREARDRVSNVQHDLKENIDRIQDAAKAGKEAFVGEMKKAGDTVSNLASETAAAVGDQVSKYSNDKSSKS